jgi:hypothetical protein
MGTPTPRSDAFASQFVFASPARRRSDGLGRVAHARRVVVRERQHTLSGRHDVCRLRRIELVPIAVEAEQSLFIAASSTAPFTRLQREPQRAAGADEGLRGTVLFRTMPRPFASFPLKLYLKRRNGMRSGDGGKETSLPHPWPFQIPRRSAAISLPCCSTHLDFGRRWPRVPFAGTLRHACEILR